MKKHYPISVNKNSVEPLYVQVFEELKKLIEIGTLKENEKLPSIRELSKSIGVNNVTVVNAYRMLEQEGLVYSKVGSGTFVRGKGIIKQEIELKREYKINEDVKINLSNSMPNPNYFPVEEFKNVINEVLDRDGGFAFTYQEPKGYFPLRESLREYSSEVGIEVNINDINIISGAQQGIDIISKTLLKFGDNVVVECPTYTGAVAVFRSRGANVIEVPIERDGINLEVLEDVVKKNKIKLLYIMTNFQNPTGYTYSEDTKLSLIYLANKYGFYIIEDDYMSELRFYGENTLPIKSIDKNNRVIYLKSFSKIFMPGIRLGYIISPNNMSMDIQSVKYSTDISTSGLMQRAFDLYIRKRLWHKHISFLVEKYKDKYDFVVEYIKENVNFIDFIEPKGGINLWCRTDMDSSIYASLLKDEGITIAPGSAFYLDEINTNYFRMSFGTCSKEELKFALDKMGEVYFRSKKGNIFNFI
ncbi:PLP-dependent aminotransferase family protein [Caloramator sp. ALD01]|uniref:MocR-like pyridoxine biosynthesis transcription factor PdxR n=1 Tax=Caloramator sp. ALD01 TaxID=1031288 RepID=UPI00041D4CD4|nr:PLP-dependent aminotransferase family protein [Caloramator sp. ALD01]